MASEERDRKFDRALARHLRSAAASAASASQHPDAETLAAYHDRGLSPEEMSFWKNHIVACGSCQSVLAHLEETDGIPVHSTEDADQLASEALPELAGVPLADGATPSLFAASARGSREPMALPAKKPRLRSLFATQWRWLAPAGAIAAVLLVWIAMYENRSIRNESEPKIAYNTPATPPSVVEPLSKLPSSNSSQSNGRSVPRGVVSSSGEGASKVLGKPDSFESREESKALAPADKEIGMAKDAERRGNKRFSPTAADLDVKHTPSGGARSIAGEEREKAESSARMQVEPSEVGPAQQAGLPAQTSNETFANQINGNLKRVPGPSALGQLESQPKLKKAGTPPVAPSAAMSDEASQSPALIAASNRHLIAAAGGAVVWRVGPAGLIEFSKDKGDSWSTQASGVSADLLAGSAPSEKICWIVGRAGTILLTVDGGTHWKLLSFPLRDDLGGADATSALHATIRDLRTTRFFETTDGGQTWQLVPVQ